MPLVHLIWKTFAQKVFVLAIELIFLKCPLIHHAFPKHFVQEKYKQLKDGTSAKYIYYGCSRSRERNCKNPYLREEDLVDQLIKLMSKVEFNSTAVQMKFEEELKRYNRFYRGVLGASGSNKKHKDIDLKTYAKYILKEGSNEEKRELMGCFESKIRINDKKLLLN